jgi:hypothetical protein
MKPAVQWTVAKTYVDAPHEYVIQGKVPANFFEYYVQKIRKEGVREQFTLRGRTGVYTYWYGPDQYKYWRVGRVLNRCKLT